MRSRRRISRPGSGRPYFAAASRSRTRGRRLQPRELLQQRARVLQARPVTLDIQPAHAGIVIALGLVGCIGWLGLRRRDVGSPDWKTPRLRFGAFVAAWMLSQVIVVFSYVWGRAQSPSAARLVIAIDTFFSFFAAWPLTFSLRRWRPLVAVLLAAGVLAIHLPIAAQHRMLNRLTQTQRVRHRLAILRESARKAHPDRDRSARPLHHHGLRRDELRGRQAGPLHLRGLRPAPLLRHLRRPADQAVDGQRRCLDTRSGPRGVSRRCSNIRTMRTC